MTTLAEAGWIPVTAEQSGDGYTWRVWVDSAEQNWTFVEARNDETGRVSSGGIGGRAATGEVVHFWVGREDGFPTLVGVRFDADCPSISIETTHRVVTIPAEQTEAHFGKRYYAMPLEEDEELFAVAGGGVRERYIPVPDIGSGETGFYPSAR
jgi:hypothetical protein